MTQKTKNAKSISINNIHIGNPAMIELASKVSNTKYPKRRNKFKINITDKMKGL